MRGLRGDESTRAGFPFAGAGATDHLVLLRVVAVVGFDTGADAFHFVPPQKSFRAMAKILENKTLPRLNSRSMRIAKSKNPPLKAGLLICVLHATCGSAFSVGSIPRL